MFYVPLKNISLLWRYHNCQLKAAKVKPMLGAQGLWAGRYLYHATPAVTQDVWFSGLIRRTTPSDSGWAGWVWSTWRPSDNVFDLHADKHETARMSELWNNHMIIHIIPYNGSFLQLQRFVCFFVLFIVAWAIFQISGDCHHYRWRGCKFRPMLSTYGF
jgi:hypothetical protein